MVKRDPLGRGLSAILKDIEDRGSVSRIPVRRITPNPTQPRFEVKEDSLKDLAASIKEKGVLQPLLLRQKGNNYEIIAGERRFRASIIAGLTEVPAIVREADDRECLEIALIENLQREDLNPVEVATVYERFVSEFGYTHDDLARKIGVERSSVTNYIRLLRLPEWIRQLVVEGKLTQGHARALITLKSERDQRKFVNRVLKEKLSVRELEQAKKREVRPRKSPFQHVEEMLREILQTKVQVTFKKSKGKLIVEFYSKDDLDRIVEFFSNSGQ